ncbi:hypothetical protein ACFLRA_03980 [Bdellovibrionota bacterium]
MRAITIIAVVAALLSVATLAEAREPSSREISSVFTAIHKYIDKMTLKDPNKRYTLHDPITKEQLGLSFAAYSSDHMTYTKGGWNSWVSFNDPKGRLVQVKFRVNNSGGKWNYSVVRPGVITHINGIDYSKN